MNRLLLCTLLALGLCSSLHAQPVLHLQNSIEQAREVGYSGVILMAKNGEVIFEEAIGFRSYERQIPLQTTDLFEMASISKQFTAMIVMMCQEKGLLNYDDPVEKYLKIPYTGITIRHLLNHTSGLPDYQAIMDAHWDKRKVADNRAILKYLRKYAPPRLFAPGERYEYSNTGYVVLASIAEKASGKDFIELSRTWIFEPLRMTDTDIRTLEAKAAVARFAAGHLKNDTEVYVNANQFHESDYTVWLGNRKGPGRVSSTAQDLLRWDQALYSDKLVSKASLQQAFAPAQLNSGQTNNYGFGWDLEEHPVAGKIVSHNGDNPGYQTIIIRLIDQHKTLIVLNNNAHEFQEALIDVALDALLEW